VSATGQGPRRRGLHNPHAGEILMAEFLTPMTLLPTELARAVGVPPRRINEIVLGKRAITARHRPEAGALFRRLGWILPRPAG
jgi:hypothetical protein